MKRVHSFLRGGSSLKHHHRNSRSLLYSFQQHYYSSSSSRIHDSDPLDFVRNDLHSVRNHLSKLVEKRNIPILDMAAQHLLGTPGKMVRPGLVCLLAYCCLPVPVADTIRHRNTSNEHDLPKNVLEPDTFHRQLRLAEVTELIHTASLIHDDILDDATSRRGKPSVHTVHGTKVAVLAGDYLLARASHWIATLECSEVVIRMTRALEDLTCGEIIQRQGVYDVDTYLTKTYCKTASLLDNSLASVAILCSGRESNHVKLASDFGRHLGIAFQIIDDCLDFTGSSATLGKPSHNDLRSGVATLPVLIAASMDADIQERLLRNFSQEGDVDSVIEGVTRLGTVPLAQARAWDEYEKAMGALQQFHHSEARDVLINAAQYVLTRTS
eukprot:PhF_6_TR26577/c0_g1_i1/m.38458